VVLADRVEQVDQGDAGKTDGAGGPHGEVAGEVAQWLLDGGGRDRFGGG
jgi:hypothetical protein